MENFQDFLVTVEDKNFMGYTEALARKENNNVTDESDDNEAVKYQVVDVSPSEVLGLSTGKKNLPVNGEQLSVKVQFNHDCEERNPQQHLLSTSRSMQQGINILSCTLDQLKEFNCFSASSLQR